jgi:anti-sigma factor (TIGR02949 family)
VQCAETLRVQAYFDAEVDAISAAEIERHTEHCAECREQLQELQRTRTAIRQTLKHEGAPPELRARIASALDQEATTLSGTGRSARPPWLGRPSWLGRPFWLGALSGLTSAAIAAGIAFVWLVPTASNVFLDDLAAAHVRSLMPSHLIDVVSSDRHTVKPWFEGHADVSPTVADFSAQGFKLVGGRADYLDHQRTAVVVYQHGAHIINVFTWHAAPGSIPKSTTRDGYRVLCWKDGDLGYCAVSDTGWDELSALTRLLRAQ